MIYHITHETGGRGCHKVARPVKNREELLALRNSEENLRHLEKARQGDDKEKAQLVQLAYNLGHVSGRLAGCKSIGETDGGHKGAHHGEEGRDRAGDAGALG